MAGGGTAVVVAGAAHAHTLNVVLVPPDWELQPGTSPLSSSAWKSRIEYENGMTHVIMFRSWLPMGRTISRVQCSAMQLALYTVRVPGHLQLRLHLGPI